MRDGGIKNHLLHHPNLSSHNQSQRKRKKIEIFTSTSKFIGAEITYFIQL
jgi:hypothetical protein